MPDQEESKWSAHTGDAKYHLGTSFTKEYPNGKNLTIEILANPSHLECVNPVVMGRVRAENHTRMVEATTGDKDAVVPILIHGDASFSG